MRGKTKGGGVTDDAASDRGLRPSSRQRLPAELYQAPRSWTDQAYSNLTYCNEVDQSGHFAAWQEPEIFTNELRAAFTSLR